MAEKHKMGTIKKIPDDGDGGELVKKQRIRTMSTTSAETREERCGLIER